MKLLGIDLRIISHAKFVEASSLYPNSAVALDSLYRTLKSNDFDTPTELKTVYPSLDKFKYVDHWWVIDISGNSLRFISCIDFRIQNVFVKHIVSHADYDKLCKQYSRG